MKKRPELRIVVSSATLDADDFQRYFGDKSIILPVEGRMYPVEIFYLNAPCTDYVTEAVETVIKIHNQEEPGDILVFLTGREEIENALSSLNAKGNK